MAPSPSADRSSRWFACAGDGLKGVGWGGGGGQPALRARRVGAHASRGAARGQGADAQEDEQLHEQVAPEVRVAKLERDELRRS